MKKLYSLGNLLVGAGMAGTLLVAGGCVTRVEMAPGERPQQTTPTQQQPITPTPSERESPKTRPQQGSSESGSSQSSSAAEPQSQETRRMEQRIVEGVNEQRREEGLQPLEAVPQLNEIARGYSRRMAKEDFYGHVAPDGQTLQDRFQQAGVRFSYVGENIYKSWRMNNPAESAVQGWMKSPGHRENILRPQFTQSGVGVWKEGETVYATQVFRRP